ncbi:hypothetical protein COP1_041798 [Malus domestica]
MFPQIQRSRNKLKRMQCFLKDADAKHEDDLQVHNWVSDIRNAAYDAEDLIDTYILKIEAYKRWEFVKRYVFILKALTLKKLKFSANGLLQVELLELELLENLEELEVEESAMPNFKSLHITNHKWIRKLHKGMKYVTALQVLELQGMSGRFIDRLRGQYHHKTHHVPSIIKS